MWGLQVLAHAELYPGTDPQELPQMVVHGLRPDASALKEKVRELLDRGWSTDANKRPGAAEGDGVLAEVYGEWKQPKQKSRSVPDIVGMRLGMRQALR